MITTKTRMQTFSKPGYAVSTHHRSVSVVEMRSHKIGIESGQSFIAGCAKTEKRLVWQAKTGSFSLWTRNFGSIALNTRRLLVRRVENSTQKAHCVLFDTTPTLDSHYKTSSC